MQTKSYFFDEPICNCKSSAVEPSDQQAKAKGEAIYIIPIKCFVKQSHQLWCFTFQFGITPTVVYLVRL
jgi:hypothetical protein